MRYFSIRCDEVSWDYLKRLVNQRRSQLLVEMSIARNERDHVLFNELGQEMTQMNTILITGLYNSGQWTPEEGKSTGQSIVELVDEASKEIRWESKTGKNLRVCGLCGKFLVFGNGEDFHSRTICASCGSSPSRIGGRLDDAVPLNSIQERQAENKETDFAPQLIGGKVMVVLDVGKGTFLCKHIITGASKEFVTQSTALEQAKEMAEK